MLKAKFEADAGIIGHFLNHETLMALTNDSNIPIVAGDDFIAVKEYAKDGNLTIVSTCKTTLAKALGFLGKDSLDRVELKDAACHIFENVKSKKLGALIMVALGCDIFKNSITGTGPKTLRKIMVKLEDSMASTKQDREEYLFHALLDHTATVTRLGIQTVDTLVKCIIYKPTNYALYDCQDIVTSAFKHTYFNGSSPTKLPMYLTNFASSVNTIIDEDGTTVMECTSVGNHLHLFLQSFCSWMCFSCNQIFCCSCSEILNDKSYCLQCYAAKYMVPSRDGDYMSKTSKMRTLLSEQFNYPGANELSMVDVEEAYECCLLSVVNHEQLVGGVKYLLYPTSEIEDLSKWSKNYTLQFKDGGTFVTNPQLLEHLPAILNLFSSFVHYEKKKQTCWMKDASMYNALPAMFINIAQHSQVDSGYQLLERCVRHGMILKCNRCSSTVLILSSSMMVCLGLSLQQKCRHR